MIYHYIFKVRFLKGNECFFVNYLVSFCEISNFIHYLEKKSSFEIVGIYDYRKCKHSFCCKTWFV